MSRHIPGVPLRVREAGAARHHPAAALLAPRTQGPHHQHHQHQHLKTGTWQITMNPCCCKMHSRPLSVEI